MRGLFTILLGKDLSGDAVSTILVVCSGDALHCSQIVAHLQNRFPKAQFTYVAPQAYLQIFPDGADVRLTSEIKKAPFRSSRNIRRRKFDVTVLMLTGEPIFRKAKLWALFTNYRMLLVYNENLDFFSCTSANRAMLVRHLKWRVAEKGFPNPAALLLTIVLFPLGILYLVIYTGWVIFQSRIRLTSTKGAGEGRPA